MKIQKKNCGEMWGGGGGMGRIEVFVKKKSFWSGGQGGCELKIKVLEKIHKKKKINGGGPGEGGSSGLGGGGGGRVDVNEELKIMGKFTQKNREGGAN